VGEGVEPLTARPLATAGTGTSLEVEDSEERHATLILCFEEEPFEGPASLIAVPCVWVERVLDGGHGMGDGEVVAGFDDDQRSHLSWMEKLNLLHREVVASRCFRETPSELSRREVREPLAGIFSGAASDLDDPLSVNGTHVVRGGRVCNDPLSAARKRDAAVENRTTTAAAGHQSCCNDDRSPNPANPSEALHLALIYAATAWSSGRHSRRTCGRAEQIVPDAPSKGRAAALARSAVQLAPGPDPPVGVPSTSAAARTRGFYHSARTARSL
jgi:hypothetical protein